MYKNITVVKYITVFLIHRLWGPVGYRNAVEVKISDYNITNYLIKIYEYSRIENLSI